MRLHAVLIGVVAFSTGFSASGRLLLVGSAELPSLGVALGRARAGDTLRLLPGVYRERELELRVPLTLEGTPGAILDAEGRGEILRIYADGTTIRGLTLRRSGLSFLHENAAIRIEGARNCRIENNLFEECFFAIYLAKAARCTVQNNRILGKAQREALSGNGIHLWYCRDIVIRSNVIIRHRDGIYFEFVRSSLIEHNISEHNLRYGLHFMFSDSCLYRFNVFRHNGAGVAVMYSRFITMEHNRFENAWGSSAFGLLLKDISASHVQENLFQGNSTALYLEGSNANQVTRNRFLANGWALRVMANSIGNTFADNSFIANTIDVSTNSRTSFNVFRHNYWSRYRGYDLDHDGYGDVPFHPVNAFAVLMERYPVLLLFMRSFLAELWDLVEHIFPVLTPAAIVDSAPRMSPAA